MPSLLSANGWEYGKTWSLAGCLLPFITPGLCCFRDMPQPPSDTEVPAIGHAAEEQDLLTIEYDYSRH